MGSEMCIRDRLKDKKKEKKNIALNTEQKKFRYKKPFKGTCRNCGKQGHKAADCWAPGGGKTNNKKKQRKSN